MKIRRARADEADALTALCKRSKAHWGYDSEFMHLSEAALTITPVFIASGNVLVADKDGQPIGIASVASMKEDGKFELVHLFVEPGAMTSGTGRALFTAAVGCARSRGGKTLLILSDPNAVDFYRRMGAKDCGYAPSDSIPGRALPLLAYRL